MRCGKLVYVPAQQPVYLFFVGVVEKVNVFLHDVFVVAHGRSRLCLGRRQGLYLGRCLSDERTQGLERQLLPGQQVGGYGVEMVGKVAGEDGCQVEMAALFRCGFDDLP